jgi:hypothetical protein
MKRLLLVLAACSSETSPMPDSPWPEKPELSALPHDPRLGTPIFERDTAFNQGVAAVYLNDYLYVAIGEWATQQIHVFEISGISTATPQVSELPLPPAANTFGFQFGVSLAARGCLLVVPGAGLLYWDGAQWTTYPALPAQPYDQLALVMARSATELLFTPGALSQTAIEVGFYWNGTAWSRVEVPLGARTIALGPWDGTELRIITERTGQLCTTLYDVATSSAGADVCTNLDGRSLETDALNGTVDDFVVGTSAELFRFSGGAWSIADSVYPMQLRLSPRAAATVGGGPGSYDVTPAFSDATNGVTGPSLVASYNRTLACSCERAEDPQCPCHAQLVDQYVEVSRRNQDVAIVTNRIIDHRQLVYMRGLALPVLDSPLVPAWP